MTSRGIKQRLSFKGDDLIVGKPNYESPRSVPLGELARGFAKCGNGTFPVIDFCTAGGDVEISCVEGFGDVG